MKRGFTLPDVLMTLAIIGIISAILIPGLRSNTDVRKSDAMYAKYCYVLDSALTQAMVKNHVVNPENVTFEQLAQNLNGTLNNVFIFKDGTILAPVPNTKSYRVRFRSDLQIPDRYYKVENARNGIDCSNNGQATQPQ